MKPLEKTVGARATAGAGRGVPGKMAADVRGGTPMAAGMGEAISSLMSQGSGMKFDKKTGQNVYKTGRFKGLTTAQVEEKGKQMWDKASPKIREKYAARVANRATDSEKAAAGGMAAFSGQQEVVEVDKGIVEEDDY